MQKCKVTRSCMSRLIAHPSIFKINAFQTGKFDDYLCTVIFGIKFPKLYSRSVYSTAHNFKVFTRALALAKI